VRKAARSPFDAALIDLGLPGLDGYEVARRIRAVLGPSIVLIAHTAYDGPEYRERTRAAGFDAHLVKPTDLQELTDWLSLAEAGLHV
jgi:CheY-like chemotaxis protein